eukprot:g4052.t1
MSSFASSLQNGMSRDEFIAEMVSELKLSPSGNFDLPRKPSILMTLSEAVEELSYDWPEVHTDVLKTIHDFLLNIPYNDHGNNSKNSLKNLKLYNKINISNSVFEGLMSCTILNENDKDIGKEYRSSICGHICFVLPYRMLKEAKRNYDTKNMKNIKLLKNILNSWDLINVHNGDTDKSDNNNDDTCSSLSNGNNKDDTSASDILLKITNDVTALIRDHGTIDATQIPNVVESLAPYIDHPEASTHVLPLLGQIVATENFVLKKYQNIKNSSRNNNSKSTMNTMIISQVLQKLKIDHIKKIQGAVKAYVLKGTPYEMFPIFIGAVSLCKFIVTYIDLYSQNVTTTGATGPLIQAGIIQHLITLCVGNNRKKVKKKTKQNKTGSINDARVDASLFENPPWIIAHNFMLWYALNNHSFAMYIVNVPTFVNLIRSDTYGTNKRLDALFWEIIFNLAAYFNGTDQLPNPAMRMLNNIFPLEVDISAGTAQQLYVVLERLINSKIFLYSNSVSTGTPPLLQDFKKYCLKLQKLICGHKINIYLEKTNNNAKDSTNESNNGPPTKEHNKIALLKKKFIKLFKNFLDKKDA